MRLRRIVLVLPLLPALVFMIIFVGLPAADGLRISFSDWRGFGPVNYIGFDNYVSALTEGAFLSSLKVTLIYAALSMVGIMAIGTVLAAAVSFGARGKRFYRVVWFLPGIAPITAIGIFWAIAFQPVTGAVNATLGWLGFGDAHTWLASPDTAIYPVVVATIWANAGFAFLLMLGAMEQVPVNLYEAARIDGTGTFGMFWRITFPLVRPVLAITSLLELIFQFNNFTMVWAMTRGGPGFSTTTLPVLVYKQAFQLTKFGPGSAVAIMGGVVLIIIGVIGLRLSRSAQEVG